MATGVDARRYSVQTYRAEREFMSAQLGERGWSSDRYVAGRVRVKQLFTGCVQSMLSDLQLLSQFWSGADGRLSQRQNRAEDGAKAFARKLREQVAEAEEVQWREELARLSSLKLYRRLKQQLVREDYLTVSDSNPRLVTSVWNRRCIADMARLRCGVADIALVRGRRNGVARQQRYCRWCDRERRRNGGLLWCRAVEDEEHVLLQCGAYAGLRKQLDADIAEMTMGEEIINDRLVRTGGIRLLATLQSHCHDDSRAQEDAEWVLALILGGCILRAGDRRSAQHDAMRAAVMQRCMRYCGDVMQARKAWWSAMETVSETESDDSEGDA
jgi:hypothetical protein